MKISLLIPLFFILFFPGIKLSGQELTPGPDESVARIYVVDPSFVPVENLPVVIKNTGSGESHELKTTGWALPKSSSVRDSPIP